MFDMKFFFSHGVKTESGDDKLAKLLDGQGIKVARRIVAKYREAPGILPSHLRKSFS